MSETITIVNNLKRAFNDLLDDVAVDAVKIMKKHAPKPSGKSVGLGSESTGTLRESIQYWNTSETTRVVGPNSGKRRRTEEKTERVGDYAKYANYGRGAVKPKYAKALVFKPMNPIRADRPIVTTTYAKPMNGWNFLNKTVVEIDNNFKNGAYKLF